MDANGPNHLAFWIPLKGNHQLDASVAAHSNSFPAYQTCKCWALPATSPELVRRCPCNGPQKEPWERSPCMKRSTLNQFRVSKLQNNGACFFPNDNRATFKLGTRQGTPCYTMFHQGLICNTLCAGKNRRAQSHQGCRYRTGLEAPLRPAPSPRTCQKKRTAGRRKGKKMVGELISDQLLSHQNAQGNSGHHCASTQPCIHTKTKQASPSHPERANSDLKRHFSWAAALLAQQLRAAHYVLVTGSRKQCCHRQRCLQCERRHVVVQPNAGLHHE